MTTFNADAYRAAREPFTLVVNGRTHVARPVSAELVIRLQPDLASSNARAFGPALRALLREAFPYHISMWWLGDPVRHVLNLDPATRNALVTSFFRYLGGVREMSPEMAGTP